MNASSSTSLPLLAAFFLGLAPGLAGCSEEGRKAAGNAFEVFAQDLSDAADSGREQLEGFLEDTSEDLKLRIEELERRAKEQGLDQKLDAALAELRVKKEQLDQRLTQLEAAGAAGWKELKAGAVNAAREARLAWEEAAPDAAGDGAGAGAPPGAAEPEAAAGAVADHAVHDAVENERKP